MPRFVDTNVALYSISDDPTEAPQRRVAQALFDATDLVVSTQVLSEFYVQATRPPRSAPLTHDQAVQIIVSLTRYPVQPVTLDVVVSALTTKERFQISHWDALIIEAARAAGCHEVLSEDLSSDQDYGGVVVRNPFVGQ
ncbi:MAG: PIN domain-containing protein [Nocardioides sp.]|uniref:PIN domain-containing protein n=1 Tax=Nocardioides sp. TaxID=35761 RepID=UPI0039E2E1DC